MDRTVSLRENAAGIHGNNVNNMADQNFDNLILRKDDAVFIAAQKNRNEGRNLLASKVLDWEPFDEEDNLLRSILLDYLYDHLMFAVKKGFSWLEVCCVFQIVKEMQEETVGQTLTDALKLFNEKVLKYGTRVSLRNMEIFSEQFFATFMSHYNLFQYCFTNAQDQMISDNRLLIETPREIEPLKDAKEIKIWEYDEKLSEIDRSAETHRNEKIAEREKIIMDDFKTINDIKTQTAVDENTTLDKENILKIVKGVTSAYIGATLHTIQSNIELSMDELEHKLERTLVPRPAELGPPPRYKLNEAQKLTSARKDAKSPKSPKGSRNNSLKVQKTDRSKSPKSARSRKN
ncbi:uncharacterized protein C8orf74 homolog [Tubulanus polymorphus]|uniref:uncharacterized protein C8orf74 homolog n=1 Tax=Tubulanus polymorphus TaxID=672921 RepID=UPI003DA4AB41